jgi:hypothetical protein
VRLLRVLLAPAIVVGALVGGASAAGAAPAWQGAVCTSGNIASGTYRGLTIAGDCTVPNGAVVIVRGDLVLKKGSYFNAFTQGTVLVTGNIRVGAKALLALGCTPQAIQPPSPCGNVTTHDTVGGSIVAVGALTMYLDGDTIGGNLVSLGGGPGPVLNPYVNFPIKDNTILGNVYVQGWKGAWFGFIRNVTLGNVILIGNVGVTTADGQPDSTEVVTNTIAGNLACYANIPAAQIGDSGGGPNIVGGLKLGQCAKL